VPNKTLSLGETRTHTRNNALISHDRWFLDRIATHNLALEDNSKVTFFDGNFPEYEAWRTQTLGEAATRPHRITYRKLTR
jgi:ATPase subunit of ABC transporter with duplicated ATPase domains